MFFRCSKKNDKNIFKKKNDFYDDYAHHPTEIKSILDGVKNVYKDRKIISIFEPHSYSRVLSLKKNLLNRFINQSSSSLSNLRSRRKEK